MKVLLAHNFHRNGGGSDDSVIASAAVLGEGGDEVALFTRDSASIGESAASKLHAFMTGIYAPRSVAEFRRELASVAPDVVHVHELYPLLSPWVLPVCAEAGIPVVMTCHDYRLTCPVATHYSHDRICTDCLEHSELRCVTNDCRANRLESTAFAARSAAARLRGTVRDNVSVYVTPTRFAADWLVRHGAFPKDRAEVVPYVIPVPDVPPRVTGGDYVAYAGRFVPEKGVSTLLEAVRLAGLPLHLAGAADPDQMAGAPAGVTYHGLLDAPALREFYARARMLVVPSTWFETFGIVAGEAMGHRLPVVASDIGALAEVVDDGVTGLLFEPGNATDLAARLSELWEDPERCSAMGEAGRAKIARECSTDAHYAGLRRAYEQALDLGRPAPFMKQRRR